MKETQYPRRIGRSIGAVLIGILVGASLSFVTDELLRMAGIFPALLRPMGDALLLLATAIVPSATSWGVTSWRGLRPIGRCSVRWQAVLWALSSGRGHHRDVELRARAPLVRHGYDLDLDALRLGGRQTPRDAVTSWRGSRAQTLLPTLTGEYT